MLFLTEKKNEKTKEPSKPSAIEVAKNKKPRAIKRQKRPTAIKQKEQTDVWQAFDDAFTNFRSDFENLLFPEDIDQLIVSVPEVRIPAIDLEDSEKEFRLKAEMPGFKKEDIEIRVQEDGVEISGLAGWKYSEKEKDYLCKERACKSFYRYVELPENIKVDDAEAEILDGVLEVTLPKIQPKKTRKLAVK